MTENDYCVYRWNRGRSLGLKDPCILSNPRWESECGYAYEGPSTDGPKFMRRWTHCPKCAKKIKEICPFCENERS